MCDHENTVVDVKGSRFLSGGEVDDTLTECLLCLDCLEYIEELEAVCNQNSRHYSYCDDFRTYTLHEKGICLFCEEHPDASVFHFEKRGGLSLSFGEICDGAANKHSQD